MLFPEVEIEERSAEAIGVNNTARVAVEPSSLGAVAALSNFSLQFHSSDHKIRHIAVMAENRFARFAFADQNGDDVFSGAARWHNLSQGVGGEISGVGVAATQIDIEPGPPDHTLVLTGFEFRRKDETDANVRTLGVALDSAENKISVTLLDDMGPDFRNFETTVGVTALISLTPFAGPAHIGAFADGVSRLNGGLEAGSRRGRPYAFSVQYAWIPNRVIEIADGAHSGEHHVKYVVGEDRVARPTYDAVEGLIALQGFHFTFTRSDHHLYRMLIDLADENEDLRGAEFRDSDYGDAMQWTVEYVTLKD